MSLQSFDRLAKTQELQNARASLAQYETSSRRSDLSETDKVWLAGAVEKARKWVAQAERSKEEWWS